LGPGSKLLDGCKEGVPLGETQIGGKGFCLKELASLQGEVERLEKGFPACFGSQKGAGKGA
jgi:hypothetical protein